MFTDPVSDLEGRIPLITILTIDFHGNAPKWIHTYKPNGDGR